MANRFVKRYRAVAGLKVSCGRVFLDRASPLATRTRRRLLEVGSVLIRQPFIDRSSDHPPDLVAEVLNLREGRVDRRAVAPKATGCHRSNAFVELPSRLVREFNQRLSVLAHDRFLSN